MCGKNIVYFIVLGNSLFFCQLQNYYNYLNTKQNYFDDSFLIIYYTKFGYFIKIIGIHYKDGEKNVTKYYKFVLVWFTQYIIHI